MPLLRIENKTDDDIIVFLDGGEKIDVREGESHYEKEISKGMHEVVIHRSSVPFELDINYNKKGLEKLSDNTPKSHVQLDTAVKIDINSSKSALVIKKKVRAFNTLHEDVLFVSYEAQGSGCVLSETKDRFANKKIKMKYASDQIRGALFPVGIIGIFVTVFGIFSLIRYFAGKPIGFLWNKMSLAYCVALLAAGVCVCIYFLITVFKIVKRVRELS